MKYSPFLMLLMTFLQAPASAAWGSGGSAGTLSGDTWTPGRDGSGIVNLASWNLVPANRWIEIAGTRLDGLDAAVKAAVPGWSDIGNEDWNGVTDDWNGMAWDDRMDSERGWLVVSGGHAGSSNDGIYEFTLRKMQWRVQRMPSDISWWPGSYNTSGTFTGFPPAAGYYSSNQANPEGVYSDEFYDPNNLAKSIRTPTSRHTYGSTIYVPSLGGSGRILMGCRRYWEYDLGTDAWALPKFPFGNQVGYNGTLGYTGENMQGWWNETEGRYYVCATQDYGGSQAWSVLAGGTGWRWEGGYPTGGYQSFYTAQEKLGRRLHTLAYDDYPANLHGKPLRMTVTHLDTRQQVSHDIALGSSLLGITFRGDWWDGQGMTFVPEKGEWFCNIWTTAGMKWCWLDTATWTLDTAVMPGSYPGSVNTLTETKVKYLPALQSLIWVNTASLNIRLIKFGSGAGMALESRPAAASLCENAISIFPNPGRAADVHINHSKAGGVLRFVDVRGKVADRAKLRPGAYVVQVLSGSRVVAEKRMVVIR